MVFLGKSKWKKTDGRLGMEVVGKERQKVRNNGRGGHVKKMSNLMKKCRTGIDRLLTGNKLRN